MAQSKLGVVWTRGTERSRTLGHWILRFDRIQNIRDHILLDRIQNGGNHIPRLDRVHKATPSDRAGDDFTKLGFGNAPNPAADSPPLTTTLS